MTVRKTHRSAEGVEPELVVVDLGSDAFQAEVIEARLNAEGIKTGSWDTGLQAKYGHLFNLGTVQLLVRRADLPAVHAAMADAGLAP